MIELFGSFIIQIISSTGYLGIFLLMALESALIPIPSEVTMPFSGSLVPMKFDLITLSIVGSLGNLTGSLLAYALGYWGQENVVRSIIKNYGKYLLISEKEFDHAKKWFLRYGDAIIFISRLMPVLRTFISLPAGIAKMGLKKFVIYTTAGSFLWSLFLAFVGMILGQNWKNLEGYFRRFDIAIVIAILATCAFYVYYKVNKLKTH